MWSGVLKNYVISALVLVSVGDHATSKSWRFFGKIMQNLEQSRAVAVTALITPPAAADATTAPAARLSYSQKYSH